MTDYTISTLLAALIAAGACLLGVWVLRPLAMRFGLVDHPSERKRHASAVPLVGGIAIFGGLCAAWFFLGIPFSGTPYHSLWWGSVVLLLVGIADDFSDLSAGLRFATQCLVALIASAWSHVLIQQIGAVWPSVLPSVLPWAMAWILTAWTMVAYINAFNMMDGQNGLAASVAMAQSICLLVFAHQLYAPILSQILLVLLTVLSVFLVFNARREACIFMGDAGSTFLAFVMIWIAVILSQKNAAVVQPVALLWVVTLPLFDLIQVILHRWRQGQSIFKASCDHVHHVLDIAGWSKLGSTLFLCGLTFIWGMIGYILNVYHISGTVIFILWVMNLLLYLWVIRRVRLR